MTDGMDEDGGGDGILASSISSSLSSLLHESIGLQQDLLIAAAEAILHPTQRNANDVAERFRERMERAEERLRKLKPMLNNQRDGTAPGPAPATGTGTAGTPTPTSTGDRQLKENNANTEKETVGRKRKENATRTTKPRGRKRKATDDAATDSNLPAAAAASTLPDAPSSAEPSHTGTYYLASSDLVDGAYDGSFRAPFESPRFRWSHSVGPPTAAAALSFPLASPMYPSRTVDPSLSLPTHMFSRRQSMVGGSTASNVFLPTPTSSPRANTLTAASAHQHATNIQPLPFRIAIERERMTNNQTNEDYHTRSISPTNGVEFAPIVMTQHGAGVFASPQTVSTRTMPQMSRQNTANYQLPVMSPLMGNVSLGNVYGGGGGGLSMVPPSASSSPHHGGGGPHWWNGGTHAIESDPTNNVGGVESGLIRRPSTILASPLAMRPAQSGWFAPYHGGAAASPHTSPIVGARMVRHFEPLPPMTPAPMHMPYPHPHTSPQHIPTAGVTMIGVGPYAPTVTPAPMTQPIITESHAASMSNTATSATLTTAGAVSVPFVSHPRHRSMSPTDFLPPAAYISLNDSIHESPMRVVQVRHRTEPPPSAIAFEPTARSTRTGTGTLPSAAAPASASASVDDARDFELTITPFVSHRADMASIDTVRHKPTGAVTSAVTNNHTGIGVGGGRSFAERIAEASKHNTQSPTKKDA